MHMDIVGDMFIWKKESCKVLATGHSIRQWAWPLTLMMPFLWLLGVNLYSWYGSRYLVCKILQFEFCKGHHETFWLRGTCCFINGNQTSQFAADNADDDLDDLADDDLNLDGREKIHTIGITVVLWPGKSKYWSSIPQNIVSNAQLSKLSSKVIFNVNNDGVKQLAGSKYNDYMIPAVCHKYGKLWKWKQLSPNVYPLC